MNNIDSKHYIAVFQTFDKMRLFTCTFILFLVLLVPTAYCQVSKKDIKLPKMEYYLTSKIKQRYSVLKFDRNRDGNLFDSSNKASIISATEINLINLLIKKQIAVYNKKGQQVINKPEKYFKQIIAVVNSNGEKIVWVNCLCEVFTGQWKKTIPIVSDGGACYFSLKINLTQKRSYDFYVNGLA